MTVNDDHQKVFFARTYPESFDTDIEWTKIKEVVASFAINEPAKEKIGSTRIASTPDYIRRQLQWVDAFKDLLEEQVDVPLGEVEEVAPLLNSLAKPGYVLDVTQLVSLSLVLRIAQACARFYSEKLEENHRLSPFFLPMLTAKAPLQCIDRVLDEEGAIRPDASPELLRISNEIEAANRKLHRVFDREMRLYAEKGWLKETSESIKSGFRVLSVKPEFKRQIPGLVIDESASGQTFYIAPQALIAAHNTLQHLEADYHRELHRILREISDELRPFIPEIEAYHPAIIALDVLRAKTKYAVLVGGHLPEILDRPEIEIKSGVHPVLYLKNQRNGIPTVRFDLRLTNEQRILLISGPNAGGKSILMKAVALLQTMTQYGLLPPVHPDSKLGVFRTIFSDIGDQQSLEEDLSTYSSRLKNMSTILRHANRYSLLLIDEFGSGTDPAIGGALAESMLYHFIKKKCYGVITTHYSNLKIFAARQKGVFNGAMLFDKERLTPTYQFLPGNPGSSFAYEIAKKSGIPERVIRAARKKVGRSQTEVEDLLIQLRKDNDTLQSQLQEYRAKGQNLDALIRQYDALKHSLFVKKKKLQIEEQELKISFLNKKQKALTQLMKELREKADLDRIEVEKAAAKKRLEQTSQSMQDNIEAVYYQEGGEVANLKAGDFVRLRIGGMKGQLIAINNRKGTIDCGAFTLESPLKDLIKISQPIRQTKSKSPQVKLEHRSRKFDTKLDIRGMGRSDALDTLQQFLDEALLSNAFELTILHGKGNGVLKEAVRTKLKEYEAVQRVFHPAPEQGGDGITIVQLG